MVDGLAIECRCRYLPKKNKLCGICREHGIKIKTEVTDYKVILDAEAALHAPAGEERCHYGKDGTVVAVAPYARTDHYTPVPILLSASCKKENGEELAEWLQVLLNTWRDHPMGEHTHGPIWSLASDGESSFRRARFLLCMSSEIDRFSPLGQKLSPLKGMNCLTGPSSVCGTCDPKHILKRKFQ